MIMITMLFTYFVYIQGSTDKAPKILRIVGDRGYRGDSGPAGPRVSIILHATQLLITAMSHLCRARMGILDMMDPREFVDTE